MTPRQFFKAARAAGRWQLQKNGMIRTRRGKARLCPLAAVPNGGWGPVAVADALGLPYPFVAKVALAADGGAGRNWLLRALKVKP